MENATKALLIAAAVLIAILIISLSVAIYQKASNATSTADLSATEIQAQNEKFLKYEGDGKRGTEVNALLETVLNYNLTTDSDLKIKVTDQSSNSTKVDLTGTETSITNKANSSKLYKITCSRNSSGVVENIYITDKGGAANTSGNN